MIQKAMKTNPNRLQYRSYLALICSKMAQLKGDPSYYRKANEQYLFCLEKDPKNSALMNAIAWNYSVLDENIDEGIRHIKKAIELDGRNPYYVGTYGCLMFRKEEYAQAINLLQESSEGHIQAGRNKVAALDLYILALLEHRFGNSDQASQTLQKAIKLDPHCRYRKKIEKEVMGI